MSLCVRHCSTGRRVPTASTLTDAPHAAGAAAGSPPGMIFFLLFFMRIAGRECCSPPRVLLRLPLCCGASDVMQRRPPTDPCVETWKWPRNNKLRA